MKEPIEELFKQSLEGHEMPYNPDAWAAMRARLDIVSPVVPPTSYLKYYIGAAVVGVAAVSTYLIIASGSPEKNTTPLANQTINENTTTPTIKSTTGKRATQSSNTSVISNPSETPISTDKGLQNTGSIGAVHPNTHKDSNTPGPIPQEVIIVDNPSDVNDGQLSNNKWSPTPPPKDVAVSSQIMVMPTVSDLCLNEETMITNSNVREIYVLNSLNQIIKTIPAKKAIIFKPEKVGTYMLAWKNNGEMQTAYNFQVNRIPDADFSIDVVNKYEKGLPATHVEAIGGQGTYIWKAEKQTANGLEADLRFYQQGEHTIELTVNNGQCSASAKKIISIERDYNLMAVTGFTPSSGDPKTSTFMPFALTQRDVNFELTILDSRDGGIVYQTSDASLPWDGTDIRFGSRSATPQVYVWKVVIFNPAPNEKNEYMGTIVMN